MQTGGSLAAARLAACSRLDKGYCNKSCSTLLLPYSLFGEGFAKEQSSLHQRHPVAAFKPDQRHLEQYGGRPSAPDRAEHMLRPPGSEIAGGTVSWTALLRAWKSYDDVERERRCFDHLLDRPTATTAHLLLGSSYATKACIGSTLVITKSVPQNTKSLQLTPGRDWVRTQETLAGST